ncbi:MAG: hypothetical protein GY765_23260 [bacterium]|nr:hypothetical protein [bacterium]
MKINKVCVALLVVFIASLFSGLGYADDLKGYMIPEYYSVASHHDGEDGIEGQHGFWLRRIYLGYNTKLGNGWSARVRFEMNSSAFESDKLYAYVKNAHVKKSIGGGASILAGIIEPPSFNKVEKFWGYRHIEKAAPDFFKLASSRDFGIALDGKTKSGLVYTVMYGNYSSNKGETDKGKAIYGRLGWEAKTSYLEANAHYAASGGKDILYLSLFGGLKGDWGRFGIGYHFKEEKPEDGEKKNNGIISAFAVAKVGKKMEVFARYDHLTDYNFKNIGDYVPIPAKMFKARFLMAGLNVKVHKMIQLSPNVKYVFYEEDEFGMKPDGDLHLNLTAKISFKTGFGKK